MESEKSCTFAGDMDLERIKQLEEVNDGQTIHLYYDDMVGMYVAFGLSAYYADMVTDPIISFSPTIGKPVALLSKANVLYLRQGLTKVDHTQKAYYRFRMRQKVGDAGYKRWEEKIVK